MAYTFGASGAFAHAGNTNSTPLAVPFPTGISAGHLLLMAWTSANVSNVPTTPSGWTLLVSRATNSAAYLFGKIASGSESGNESVTGSTTAQSKGQIARFAGNPSTLTGIVHTSAGRGSSSATTTIIGTSALTITTAGCLVITVGSKQILGSTIGLPAGMTNEIGEDASTTHCAAWNYTIQTTATNLAQDNWGITTGDGAAASCGISCALLPDSGGGGGGGGGAAAIFMQQFNQSAGSSTDHTFGLSGVTAGSFLVSFVRQSSTSDVITTFGDATNGAWTQLFTISDGVRRCYGYYKENSAAGTITISATTSSAQTWRWCMMEYSSLPASATIDVSAAATFASSTTPVSPSVTTTVATETMISFIAVDNAVGTIAPANSETERLENSVMIQVQDKASGATGSYNGQWTLNTAQAGIAAIIALKSSASGSPSITSVDSDNIITSTQTGVVVAGANFGSDGANAKGELVDGLIVSQCTKTAFAASSATFTIVQGNVRHGTVLFRITTQAGLVASKSITLGPPSGTTATTVTALRALTFDPRNCPSRLTPKGSTGDATADCTTAVQFEGTRTGGTGTPTIDADGRLSWVVASTQFTWRWHNGSVWSSNIVWDLRGPFPVFAGTIANVTLTQNVAMTAINHSTKFSYPEALPTVAYTLQGGAMTGLSVASATGIESGTPTVATTYTGRTIRSTNGEGSYVESNAFSTTIPGTAVPFFTGTILDQTDQVTTPFTLDVSGFFTNVTSWAVTSGTLPPGITLATGTGILSGTSTTVGLSSGIVITGSGTGTPAASNAFSIDITVIATVNVPNLGIGTMLPATANAAIIAAGFAVGAVSYAVDAAHDGFVIAQNPDVGEIAIAGSNIDYTVATGDTLNAFYWLPNT